jgi:signal peptidase II
VFVFVLDWITKRLAVAHLSPAHVPHEIIGDFLRFTLAYNRNAAMGLSLGEFSRIGFTVTAIIMLVVIGAIYRKLEPEVRVEAAALGLIAGGALGNLADRLTSSLGVVDFIDVGFGDTRFWTFNIADSAVSIGAVMLILITTRSGTKPSSAG